MARRFDISDKLIHFTGGGSECWERSFREGDAPIATADHSAAAD
jgi:hypothetical protein